MPDTPFDHSDEARQALHAIVSDPEHGAASLSSPQIMSNLLKDLLPDAPREKNLLVSAAENGLADKLRNHVTQGMDPETAIRLTASSLANATAFTPDGCEWVTREIAGAIGISSPSQAGQAGPGQAVPGQGTPGQFSAQTAPGVYPGAPGAGAWPTAMPGPIQPGPMQPGPMQPGQMQPGQMQPGQMQPGQFGAPAAGSPFTAQPAAFSPNAAQGYVPTTGYQPPGAAPWPAAPGGMGPGMGGRGPVQRRRAPWFIAAGGVVVVVAVVVAVVLLQGKSTPPAASGKSTPPATSGKSTPPAVSGKTSFTLTTHSDSSNPVYSAKSTGAVDGTGQMVGIGTNRYRVTLSSGTFVATTSPDSSTYSRTVDHSTCSVTASEGGSVTYSGGTGNYSGITGSGVYGIAYVETLPRNAGGACETGSGVQPVAGSFVQVIKGHAHVSVP